MCPSDTTGQRSGNSYSINGCALNTAVGNFATGKSLAAFDETARWMMFSEEATIDNSSDDGYQLIGANTFSDRHLEGSNVAFIDGHVKFFRTEKIITDQLQTGGSGTTCP